MEAKTLEIEYSFDSHDCEICGMSSAEGWRFTFNSDPKRSYGLIASAHCYDGDSIELEDALKLVCVGEGINFDDVPKKYYTNTWMSPDGQLHTETWADYSLEDVIKLFSGLGYGVTFTVLEEDVLDFETDTWYTSEHIEEEA